MMMNNNPTSSSTDGTVGGAGTAVMMIHPPHSNNSEVLRLLNKYTFDAEYANKQYAYGTAGFRYVAIELAPVMVRVGIAAALQAAATSTSTTGVMITASHNDESYNGVKLAQSPDGGMMNAAGESMATYIVNERNIEKFLHFVQSKQQQRQQGGVVHIGRDTREHSVSFSCLVSKVVVAMGCTVYDHGIITTPMLHHCVKHYTPHFVQSLIPARPNVAGYYDLLLNSYQGILQTSSKRSSSTISTPKTKTLCVDCACGVGYPHLQYLATKASTSGNTIIVPFNPPGSGPLNEGCGSEYVQKELRLPHWYDNNENENDSSPQKSFNYCASFDGDADRIVFFYCHPQNQELRLLDGDKIAALLCQFVKEQLSIVQSAAIDAGIHHDITPIKLGVVQTAYANGASTSFLTNILGPDSVVIAKTGVKYVHTMAHDCFDIGIYFEANGHGTILFGSNFYQYMYRMEHELLALPPAAGSFSMDVYNAYQRLRLLPALVNQAVGDAISDLFLIDAILQLQDITIQEWDNWYTDLPSRQAKVQVHDRSLIRTNENETQCIEPTTVQLALDQAVHEISSGDSNNARAFIRPSGTEDVVRIYVEAPTRNQADALANRAIDIVYDLCGGVGDKPSYFLPATGTSKM